MSTTINSVSEIMTATQPQGPAKKEEAKVAEKKVAEEAAVYEKSTSESKATYKINKMSSEDRAAIVAQMKQDMIDRQSQLTDLVKQMFSKQADANNLSSLFSPDMLKKVSKADIEQAQKDVAEDGYWGVKQTSQRMFDFASALAGDDVDKMKEMQKAMEKGYKLATKAWGKELPSISKDTLDAANKLFEEYYDSKK